MAISRRKFILGGTVVAVAAGAGILTPMLTREGRFVLVRRDMVLLRELAVHYRNKMMLL